jgi:hypothetical protein
MAPLRWLEFTTTTAAGAVMTGPAGLLPPKRVTYISHAIADHEHEVRASGRAKSFPTLEKQREGAIF